MSTKMRQDAILDILSKQGYVTVQYLTEILHYSTATINRDLNVLLNKKLVVRSHGGVELSQTQYIPIFFRSHKMQVEKRNIGKTAAGYVKDGDVIFIDGSTTAQYMEQYLVNCKNLTVITNNITLAANLSQYNMRVICLGGEVVEIPSMLFGNETVENAAKYLVNKMFFATTGATGDGRICAGLYELLYKTVMRNADEIFYLVDHNKIDSKGETVLCDFSRVDYVISDYDFGSRVKESYPDTKFVLVGRDG